MMKKILAGTAIAAVASVVSFTSASAMPVAEWAVEVNSSFTSAEPGAVVISEGGAVLTWGTPITSPAQAGPSRLVQAGPGFDPDADFDQSTGTGDTATNLVVPGGLFTNGATVAGLSLTHFNNRITGAALTDAVLQDRVELTAIAPDTGEFDTMEFEFNIEFTETPNQTAPCPAGDGPPPGDLCDDIFVLTNTGPLSFNFVLDGFLYTLFLLIVDENGDLLGQLTAGQCAAAGAAAGCFGFITEEGANTQIFTRIGILAVPVPEPAALGLLGLGLIGLGAARRRRRS